MVWGSLPSSLHSSFILFILLLLLHSSIMAASSGFLTIFFPPPVFYAEMNDCKNQSYCEIHQWFSFLTPVNRTGMVDIVSIHLSSSLLMFSILQGRRQSLSIVTTTVESFVDYYFFPIQFVLGVIGNSINLVVLLSRSMRTEVRTIIIMLSGMALFAGESSLGSNGICWYLSLLHTNSLLCFSVRTRV